MVRSTPTMAWCTQRFRISWRPPCAAPDQRPVQQPDILVPKGTAPLSEIRVVVGGGGFDVSGHVVGNREKPPVELGRKRAPRGSSHHVPLHDVTLRHLVRFRRAADVQPASVAETRPPSFVVAARPAPPSWAL